jgi:cytochrome b involved in lipid metabolism
VAELKKYSWDEIKKHTSENDAWIVIDGKVYDVTSYMPTHPGGPQWIIDHLGTDATAVFANKGGLGPDHSEAARAQLAELLIGTVE